MAIVRKQAYLTTEQARAIKRLANSGGVSEAEIVRRAVAAYVQTLGGAGGEEPYADMIALGRSGLGHGSVDHDDIYGPL